MHYNNSTNVCVLSLIVGILSIRDAPLAMNGVAFHKQLAKGDEGERKPDGPSTAKLRLNKSARGQIQFHDEPSESRGGDHVPDTIPHRPLKIHSHPYIQSSNDFIWVGRPFDLAGISDRSVSISGAHEKGSRQTYADGRRSVLQDGL